MKIRQVGPNQTELHLGSGVVVFFSYETPVAAHVAGTGFVRTSTHFSTTTSRHINKWLDGAKAVEVEQSFIEGLAK